MNRSMLQLTVIFALTSSLSWAQDPPDPPPLVLFERGDANADGSRDLSDALTILLFLFDGTASPTCLDALDVDDTGDVVLTDPIFLLRFLFLGGAPVPAPVGSCGTDPTADELGCESFAGVWSCASRV